MVRRADGQVLAFERLAIPGSWQLPQGGIERGESPTQAVWRELAEETGLTTSHVRLVGEHDGWTTYQVPASQLNPQRLGQTHRWFFFDIMDPTVEPTPDGAEFGAWTWITPSALVDVVVEFRKASYKLVLGG